MLATSGVWILSVFLSSILVVFFNFCKIRNQEAAQGNDLVSVWNHLFLEIMKAVWDVTNANMGELSLWQEAQGGGINNVF